MNRDYAIELRLVEPLSLQAMFVPCRIVEVYGEDRGSGVYHRVLVETVDGHRAAVALGSLVSDDGTAHVTLEQAKVLAAKTQAAINGAAPGRPRAKKSGRPS